MRKTRIIYEPEDDVLSIWLSKKPIDDADDDNGIITHYTKDDEPVYIEILDAKRLFTDQSFIRKGQKPLSSKQLSASIPHQIKKS